MSIVRIKTIKSESGKDLLNHIFSWTETFWVQRPWIFRGQGNANHLLIPTALRENVSFPQGDGVAETNTVQRLREWGVIELFISLADQQGLHIPGLHERFLSATDFLSKMQKSISCEQIWPPEELRPIMALAQHHGIPTRILDWTRSPLTGLYFAAADAAKNSEKNNEMALWAFNTKAITALSVLNNNELITPVTIDVPYAGNPNITAQKGTFTCHLELNANPDDPVSTTDIEQIIKSFEQALNNETDHEDSDNKKLTQARKLIGNDPILLKFTCPASEGGRLLRYLSVYEKKASAIFPGYDGVTKAVIERSQWDIDFSDEIAFENLYSPLIIKSILDESD